MERMLPEWCRITGESFGHFFQSSIDVRRVPFSLKFMFNDVIRDFFKKPGQHPRDMTFNQLLGAGTLAGLSQMCITYPLETGECMQFC